MKGILSMAGMALGGWIGWWLGARLSFFAAFVVSMAGTGVGLYYAQKATRALLP